MNPASESTHCGNGPSSVAGEVSVESQATYVSQRDAASCEPAVLSVVSSHSVQHWDVVRAVEKNEVLMVRRMGGNCGSCWICCLPI